MPCQGSVMDLFPGFSIVCSFNKASVCADEQCTCGSFIRGAYSWSLINFEYRGPYTRSVCFFQICTPRTFPWITGVSAAMLVRGGLFGPKRSGGILCFVID